jgi:hypothetical protein
MILDHLATRMGTNWPYGDERAITREISETVALYKGLTWEALGDQGQQYDASSVRPAAKLTKLEAAEVSAPTDQELILVSGSVTYDGGTLFRLTPHMSNYAFGNNAGISAADAARLALNAKIHEQVLPGTLWIPESLHGAPVGNLLNGSAVTKVTVKVAERAMAVAA